mgnify:CR=1 FL=1
MTGDLREYISKLKKSKELKIIQKKVSTKFEIAGITAKADKSSALLFENIKQNNFKLVSNLVGTRKRFALAVNAKENKIHESIYSSIKNAKKPKIINSGKLIITGNSLKTHQIIYLNFLLSLTLRKSRDHSSHLL